jgi:hypothetical protein
MGYLLGDLPTDPRASVLPTQTSAMPLPCLAGALRPVAVG